MGSVATSPPSADDGDLVVVFERLWRDAARATAVALADDRETLTYAALHDRVGRMAAGLRATGVERGDRVAIAMERSVGQAVAILAVMVAGACPCPLEPGLAATETVRRLALARIGRTLVDERHRDDPAWAGVARIDVDALPDLPPCWALDLAPDAPALLLFTSGSSGAPKGVLQSHAGLMANARGVVAGTGLGADDRLLHVMPLYHTNGVNNQILAPLLAGGAVFVAPRFRADDMPALMRRTRPTIVTGVPTMYARMLAFEFAPEALATLRFLRCGSAPITRELHERVEAHFGRPLVVSYGLSEATCTSTINPPDARRIGSVGVAMPGQDVHLRDADDDRRDGADVEGEICIAGPTLMLGYLTEASRGEPQPPGAVVRTGDLGRFDADGYLFITGRLKDIIIRGGENLSPPAIERVIDAVPGVAASCVVGAPDADLGETPVAFVVRTRSTVASDALAEAIVAAVVASLGRAHRPARVHFVDALPENAVGKVDRKSLRTRAAA